MWWPEARGLRPGIGITLALLFATSALISLWKGDWLSALIPLLGVIAASFMVLDAVRRRVEAGKGAAGVVGALKATSVSWEEVADIRGGAARAVVTWSWSFGAAMKCAYLSTRQLTERFGSAGNGGGSN